MKTSTLTFNLTYPTELRNFAKLVAELQANRVNFIVTKDGDEASVRICNGV